MLGGVAVLVNKSCTDPGSMRAREVRVVKGDRQGVFLNIATSTTLQSCQSIRVIPGVHSERGRVECSRL